LTNNIGVYLFIGELAPMINNPCKCKFGYKKYNEIKTFKHPSTYWDLM
jgi:hypothetical protein